ncbi:putative DDB1- and CUL4-associated factor 7 [Monocercomonoides exilis]|uniref:putative DDB1- and CUL4-associated factor 7 n=1 Tax=Monocercomonoides exilis TaxID=2049356 RepID=UPI003559EB51|nr:putative DDB1- and CUL4-associated factor 7 [Monocercomonoides exilis]|eukprot:MONOS_12954.1-p1 / transcript=MONOS_12954.1 / gene=MONOS_12954 / organism=Monocercomonoides_exilis_PA203 / gene_product=DDB1- and CUL4-associated factor 7 homolog / transcript_product=DDB1- and CUL4-associated factor 7 homolog / location=Mono_scaffold00758:24600-29384(-) / protein_length=1520 / sequence_SO=supercontig / SO=protein_coding / is_pseudo=false
MQDSVIFEVLSQTFRGDKAAQEQARKVIRSWRKMPNYFSHMLKFTMDERVVIDIRVAAAIQFKISVKKMWKESKDRTDKQFIRENIIPSLCAAPPLVAKQLELIIGTMIECDFPKKWPNMIVQVKQALEAKDINLKIAICPVILSLCSLYSSAMPKIAKQFNKAIPVFYHPLFLSAQEILSHINFAETQQAIMLKYFCKITRNINTSNIRPYFLKPEMMRIVVEKMVQIFMLPIPETLYPDRDQRPHQQWWKCKKQAIEFLFLLYQNYSLPNPSQLEYKEFSMFWMNNIANNLISTILAELHKVYAGRKIAGSLALPSSSDAASASTSASALAEAAAPEFVPSTKSDVYMSPKVMFFAIQLLSFGLLHNVTYVVSLKPHLPLLLNEIILPNAGLTSEEIELFDEEPIEFMNLVNSASSNVHTPRTAALEFFRRLCGNRKQTALAGLLDMLQKYTAKAYEIITQAIAAGRVPPQTPTDASQHPTAASQPIWNPLQICLHLLSEVSTVVFLPSESALTAPNPAAPPQAQAAMAAQQMISPFDSMIMQLISSFVLPLLASSFPFPILRREAALFVASYAPMISVSPAATSIPNSPGASSSPLIVTLIGAAVALLDDPCVPVCVAACECITKLLSYIYAAARPPKLHADMAPLPSPSPLSIPSVVTASSGEGATVISAQLLTMVESFLPTLFEKLFNNLQRAGQASDRVIVSINRAVKVAGERMEPYATTVFTRITEMMKGLLAERWVIIDQGRAIIEKKEAEKEAAKAAGAQGIAFGQKQSASGASGAIDEDDDDDIEGKRDSDKKILKAMFGDSDDEGVRQLHNSELTTLCGALYNILHFTRAMRVRSTDQTAPLLFTQFEPVISEFLVKGLEHRDVEFIDMYVACYQIVCLVLLDFTPDKSSAAASGMSSTGGSGGGGAGGAGSSPMGAAGSGVTATMATAFTRLCQWMEVNDDMISMLIPTIQAFAQNNIEVIFNTPDISNPLFNSIRNSFGFGSLNDDASDQSSPFAPATSVVLGGTPLSAQGTGASGMTGVSGSGTGDNGDGNGDDDDDDDENHLDSAILSSVRLLKFLLIRCGIKRLNLSVSAETASSAVASTGASLSTSPFYAGIIQSPALVSSLLAMLWKRYDECTMPIIKSRVAHSILLLFFAAPLHAFGAIRKQTMDTQAAIHSVQMPQMAITSANDSDAERKAKVQKKKLRKAQKAAVEKLKLPSIPTIAELVDWIENERDEYTNSIMDMQVSLYSLLSLLSIPIEWYPEEYGIREQAVHSLLPKLYQSVATIKTELEKEIVEEQKEKAEKANSKNKLDVFDGGITSGSKSWTEGMLRMLNDDQTAFEGDYEEDIDDTSVAKVLMRLNKKVGGGGEGGEGGEGGAEDEDEDDDMDAYLLNEMIQIDESHPPQVLDSDFEKKGKGEEGDEDDDSSDDDDDDDDDDMDELDNILAAELDDEEAVDHDAIIIDQLKFEDEDFLDTYPLKGMSITAVASESVKYFSLMDKEGTFNKIIIQLMPFTQQAIKSLIGA